MCDITSTRGFGPAVRRAGPAELIPIPDAWPAGQDGVQVIVDRKVASAEPVRVARGEPGDESSGGALGRYIRSLDLGQEALLVNAPAGK